MDATTRRNFVKGALALGGILATGGCMKTAERPGEWISGAPDVDPVDGKTVRVVRTVCLGCHSACGLQCKVVDGVLAKVSGNPYHPNTREPHIAYATDPKDGEKLEGTACAKAGATIQTLYNPNRIMHPLKRVGPRGSGKWKTIGWEQAYDEIIKGGDLFGEGHVEGLSACRNLTTPADPLAPELGPKANQVVFMPGRIEHGKKEFTDRWFKDAYGTVNYRLDHTSICETSHHVGLALCLEGSSHTKPDILNAKYIIFFGTSPYEANFPMQAMARKLNFFRERKGKLVIVDPRFSNSAAKADRWVPISPGTDAAFALGMMRWMIENDRIDKRYLSFPNKKASAIDGHLTWCDASYLVRQDNRKYLRLPDIKMEGGKDEYVVVKDGNPSGSESAASADLEFSGVLNGIPVETVYSMLKKRVFEKTIQEYAGICELDPEVIIHTADEFTSYGRRAVADFYRGPVQHTNGTYAARTLAMLNFLIGNVSWKGGCEAHGGSHWHEGGGKPGNPHNLLKELHPGKVKAKGITIDRKKASYEESAEFKKNGYPAKRQWFPFAYNNVYQEVFPSIGAQYPYPTKILFTYWCNVLYSSPAGIHQAKGIRDPKILPLHVAIDYVMGETSAMADYIFPTLHFLEDWGTPHVAPTILTTTSGVRQPVIARVAKDAKSTEEIFIDIALKMGLPGYGKDGFGPGDALLTSEHWYHKLIANIAYGDKEGDSVPGATEAEKVQYVLARGGRFEDYGKSHKGNHTNHSYKGMCFFYSEKLATTRDSMSGRYYDGLPFFEPLKDAMERPVDLQKDKYPFRINTYHPSFHAQARTAASRWLMDLTPDECVEMNAGDAGRIGIRHGDMVRVYSSSYPEGVKGKAFVTEAMRPGIISIPHSLGHWEYGSKSFDLDGKATAARSFVGRGCSANPVMMLDPYLKDVCLQDPIGGSSSFYDSNVAVEKV
jgi:anaerobic selenocysteine-containing dehydrogenase